MGLFKSLRNLSLGVKLNVVVIVTFGILLAAILVVTSRSVSNLTSQTGQRRVEQEAEAIRRRFDEAGQEILTNAKLLVAAPGLAEAVANKDATSVRRIVAVGATPLDFDDTDVVDADGARIAVVVEGNGSFDTEQEDALLSLSLLGAEATGTIVEEGKEGPELRLATAIPLHSASGAVVGAVMVSRKVDDEFLTKINLSRQDVHLALIHDGQVLAADFPTPEKQEKPSAALFEEAAIEQALSGQTVIAGGLVDTSGIPYALAYVPLTVSEDTKAVVAIQTELGELFAFQRQLTTNMTITFTLLALLAMVAVALSAWKIITVPIRQLTDVAQVVTQGNLEIEAQVKSGDEIGVLTGAFNQMIVRLREMLHAEQAQREYIQTTVQRYVEYGTEVARGNLAARLTLDGNGQGADDPLILLGRNLNETTASLQGMITQIRDAANNLGSVAAEILAATTQQMAGASEQSEATSQTTITVDEVKAIAEQSASRARGVADTSQRTVEVSRTGQQAVEDTIGSMAQIKDRVEGIAENILALSEQTQQIGEIIATVNEIAAQSNMLALNASVEAARAGEHGKGFAVVAAEVRNLAEQSRQATAQVKTILSDIQRATNATVMATEEATKGVDAGVRLSAQTREAIERLSGVINESAQAATQVVAGGQQQRSGIEQIALAMQNINQATTQSLASTRQAEKAAQNLNELARSLTGTVELYQL
jgi:methyl-accepting chemotaxis protein